MKIRPSFFFAVRTAISACCVLILNSASAQSGWQWAKSGASRVFSLGTDAAGNVYAGGSYGPDILNKYDAAGNTVWTVSTGDSAYGHVSAVAVEASGNVYVTGKVRGTMAVGPDTLHGNSATSSIFTAKYDAAGHPLWARQGEGSAAYNILFSSCDAAGNIYVAGHFTEDSMVFGSTVLHNVSPSWTDIYILKYNPTGNLLWAKTIGTIGNEEVSSIAADPAGNVYVTGTFETMPLVLDTITLPGSTQSTFIAKYSSTGNVIWAQSIDHIWPADLHVNSGGDVYLTGAFNTTITIGSATLVPSGPATSPDIFLIKYTTTGGLIWAVNAGSRATAKAITTDPAGNIFMTGRFDTTAIFGTITLTGVDFFNLFLTKYDAAGNLLAATRVQSSGTTTSLPSPGQDVGCIAADLSGNAYVGGQFWGNDVIFGSHVITNSTSNVAFFLAKSGNTFLMTTEVTAASAALSVYPNPSGGLVTVSIPAKKYDQLTVYNIVGSIIYKGTIATMETNRQISLEDLPSGQYYIRASGADGAETVPVVLSH